SDDGDAVTQKLEHVFVTLAIFCAGHIGVGQLVNYRNLRIALDNCVEIHLFKHDAAIFDVAHRHALESVGKRGSFAASMRFENRDDDVDALPLERVSVFKHLPSFTDARRRADVNAQRRLVANFEFGEQRFGCRSFQFRCHSANASLASKSHSWRRSVPPAVAGGSVDIKSSEKLTTHPLPQVVLTSSKIDIQLQNVDSRLAEKSELTSFRMRCNDTAHFRFTHAAFTRDTRHLELRARW